MVEELVHGSGVDRLGEEDGGDTGLGACSEMGIFFYMAARWELEEEDDVCGGDRSR
jgi:hypothetical protein